ncbi:MAG: hypothetical protein FWD03_03735 [Defluviitaleaceae bacterium]|nr:hypothetical protein [Defluviitaleaceae bacterium]
MLKIDPDFKNLIPPLMPDEFRQLAHNIVSANRCRDAILVWKGTIVDGHNRYAICQEHGISFDVTRVSFDSKEDALIWIAENQLGRRNLTDTVRIELACYKADMLRKKAKANLAGKNPVDEPVHVRKEIAAAAGVSEQKVSRYMRIIGECEPELIDRVRKGEVKIGTAYGMLMAETKQVTVFYDDADVRYRDSTFGRGNVLDYIGRIEKLYGFVADVVLLGDDIRDMDGVERRLEGQLGVVEGLLV